MRHITAAMCAQARLAVAHADLECLLLKRRVLWLGES